MEHWSSLKLEVGSTFSGLSLKVEETSLDRHPTFVSVPNSSQSRAKAYPEVRGRWDVRSSGCLPQVYL